MNFEFVRMFHNRSLRFLLLSALVMVATGVGNAHATISMTLVDGNSNSLTCQADAISQNALGILTVDEPSCISSIDSTGTSMRFLVSGSQVTGCVFSSMVMNSVGEVTLQASDACIVVQPLAFTLQDDRFAISCEADTLLQNASGVLSLSNVSCIGDITSQAQANTTGVMAFTGTNSIAKSCMFGNMSLDANGALVLTATGDCFGDADGDGIPNPIDPNPGPNDLQAQQNTNCTPQLDALGGKQSSILLNNAEVSDVTCYLPNAPERVIAANSALGAVNSPINVDFYAKEQVILFEGTSLRGNSTMSIQSDIQTQPAVRVWGPFTVEVGSVFKVHPAPTLN